MEGKGGAIFCKMSSAQKHGLPPLALTPVVTKPPSLTTIQKHGIPSASERALHALLKKRHDKYLLKLADSTKSSDEISTPPIHWSLPDKELAEHVVHCAKRRLQSHREQHRSIHRVSRTPQLKRELSTSCRPLSKDNQPSNMKAAGCLEFPMKSAVKERPVWTPLRLCTSTNTYHSQLYAKLEDKRSVRSQHQWHSISSQEDSLTLQDSHVPPTTIAQETQKFAESNDVSIARGTKMESYDNFLKAQQRAEIYALNEVMTQHEDENFRAFLSAKV